MADEARSRLGRGLASLIGDVGGEAQHVDRPRAQRKVPIEFIKANPRNPRRTFSDAELKELSESIKQHGVIQPIVVRPVKGAQDRYEIIAGERRWRASQMAGLHEVPIVPVDISDSDALEFAIVENVQREDLNPLEEAAAYQQLLDDFGCTQEELAGRIKRSRPQISNTIRLLQLPGSVQRKVAAGVISAGHARALLMLATPEAMEHLANRIVSENLSVRAVEELVAVGESGTRRAPRTTRPREVPAAVLEVQEALTDVLDTRVTVTTSGKRGRIVIEFADPEDLDRLRTLLINR